MDFFKCVCCCSKKRKSYDVPIGYGDIYLGSNIIGALPYFSKEDQEDLRARNSGQLRVGQASSAQDDNLGRQERRITTRARFTYGMGRYEKHVMLIFAQTELGQELVDKRVALLKTSFGQFGFEVEVHVDLGPEEMEARLEEFFAKDFSKVGAVCIAAVGGTGEAGQLPARGQRCHESRVLTKLTAGLPEAMAGRPRIYITEVKRSGTAAASGVYALPITAQYPDVIAVHIPIIVEGDSNPLQMLCHRLGTERDLKAEVMSAVHEAENTFPALADRSIQVDSTLLLELELVKRSLSSQGGENVERVEKDFAVGQTVDDKQRQDTADSDRCSK